MPTVKRMGGAVVVAIMGLASAGQAQPLSNACQTQYGVCSAPLAPVGAPCVCGPGHPGRMLFATSEGSAWQGPSEAPGWQSPSRGRGSTGCATPFGVCQVPYPAPIGSPCTCLGPRGPDRGQIIGGR
jgi:hypothetical protein